MNNTHRLAIAGIGAVAAKHAAAIEEIEEATLVGGSCRTQSTGESFAKNFDAIWWTETETMLDEAHPDILIVATPSGAHLEPTRLALDRGIHVLCEKPLEITTSRIDQMIEAATTSDATLGGIFQQRFSDHLDVVATAAANGRFGNLAVANAYVPWWRDDEYYADSWHGTEALDGGGALMNQSIHAIDAIQWLAGETMDLKDQMNPVVEVAAYTDRRGHRGELMDVEDTAVAILRYRDGTLGQLLGTTSLYPGSARRLQLGGRDGTVDVLDDQLITWQFRNETQRDDEIREAFGTETDGTGGVADPMSIDHELHRRNIKAFLEGISGDDALVIGPGEARKSVAIIEAIYESATTGAPVAVEGNDASI